MATLLNKLQDDFKLMSTRIDRKTEFVAALDQIISLSPFAGLLECRNRIPLGLGYSLIFQEPKLGDQSMAVDFDKIKNSFVLEFNLTKSVQRVLFVYIHEMTHICQLGRSVQARNEAQRTVNGILGEVQAFYAMQKSYEYFIQHSARLCKAEGTNSDDRKVPLNEAYVQGALQLEQGSFAQTIIAEYLTEGQYAPHKAAVLDLKSVEHNYSVPMSRHTFKLHSLNPEFKSLIQNLGIPVVEN